jgi:hypothetical protein
MELFPIKVKKKPGIAVHACNPSYSGDKQEDHKFKVRSNKNQRAGYLIQW